MGLGCIFSMMVSAMAGEGIGVLLSESCECMRDGRRDVQVEIGKKQDEADVNNENRSIHCCQPLIADDQ